MPLLGWLLGNQTAKKMQRDVEDTLAARYGMDNKCIEPGCEKRVVAEFGSKRKSSAEGLYCKKHLRR